MKSWLFGTALFTFGLFTFCNAQGTYDHEDPEQVARARSLGMIIGINRPNAFVIMKPESLEGLKVGETVAIRRNDLIVILGKIEEVFDKNQVVIALHKFDPDGNPVRVPRFKDEVIYYPLRFKNVSEFTGN